MPRKSPDIAPAFNTKHGRPLTWTVFGKITKDLLKLTKKYGAEHLEQVVPGFGFWIGNAQLLLMIRQGKPSPSGIPKIWTAENLIHLWSTVEGQRLNGRQTAVVLNELSGMGIPVCIVDHRGIMPIRRVEKTFGPTLKRQYQAANALLDQLPQARRFFKGLAQCWHDAGRNPDRYRKLIIDCGIGRVVHGEQFIDTFKRDREHWLRRLDELLPRRKR